MTRLVRSPGVWGVALAVWSAAWSVVAGQWLGVLGFATAGCYAGLVAWQEWECEQHDQELTELTEQYERWLADALREDGAS